MSASGTIGRCGAVSTKTYSRCRQSAASRSFDDVISGRPSIKASHSYTKWGQTSFVAIRGEKRSKLEPSTQPAKKTDDPFSFETEDGRKTSPTKSARFVAGGDFEKTVTRLPASRIVTRGKNSQMASPVSFSDDKAAYLPAVARPGRVYSRSQEGRINKRCSAPLANSHQLIMDQFVEVGKAVKIKDELDVVLSVAPRVSMPVVVPLDKNLAQDQTTVGKASRERLCDIKDDQSFGTGSCDDSDDDIFPATFRRGGPMKTYGGEIVVPDDPPDDHLMDGAKWQRFERRSLRGRKSSRYTNPRVIEEYRRRYNESSDKPELSRGMFNSTVVSERELKNDHGTTLVVVCKPKVGISGKKDDVQTKYFKNVKKELDKSDKNIDFAENKCLLDQTDWLSSDMEASPATTPLIGCLATSSPSVDESASSHSSPTRLLKVKFVDGKGLPTRYTSYPVVPLPSKQDKDLEELGVSPVARHDRHYIFSENGNASSGCAKQGDTSVAMRTRSAGRQYRIFKSRGSTQDNSMLKGACDAVAYSPPMPELTAESSQSEFELSAVEDGEYGNEIDQLPPNITDGFLGVISAANQLHIDVDSGPDKGPSQPSSGEAVLDGGDSELAGNEFCSSSQNSCDESVSYVERVTSGNSSQEATDSVKAEQDEEDGDGALPATALSSPAPLRRFFKSKAVSGALSLKRKASEKSPSKASYNARSWYGDEEAAGKESVGTVLLQKRAKVSLDAVEKISPFGKKSASHDPRLVRQVHWPKDREQPAYTSVKVEKQHKELYTVVHNVKMAHEVQESGETQDFIDDLEYLMENLRDSHPFSIRSLSAIHLAGKCIMPAFRMHIRAHGIVTRIFSLLHDACSDQSLALSTAAMMFMLSRDRLNMDLDKESLHLMLKLNEVDMPPGNRDVNDRAVVENAAEYDVGGHLEKCRQRVQQLLGHLQKEIMAKQIDLDFVSTGSLAMESLLSLTSRRAGDWFKKELRNLCGLDYFVDTVHQCVSEMKGSLESNLTQYLPHIRKLDRFLRVLENVTFQNADNQTYIIAYREGLVVTAITRVCQHCVQFLSAIPLTGDPAETSSTDQSGAGVVFQCLLSALRVLVNITHNSEFGTTRIGQEVGLLETVLVCVVSTQWCIPPDHRFDLLVLTLGLLVNLMEHCVVNRRLLVETRLTGRVSLLAETADMDAIYALVQLFVQREAAARRMEEAPESLTNADATPNRSGNWHESDSGIEWVACSADSTFTGGCHTEGGDGDSQSGQEEGETAVAEKSILEDEETFTTALHKAGKHMENSIVASYVGLTIGCLIQNNQKYVGIVKAHMPGGCLEPMSKILKRFLDFMSLTTAVGSTDINSIQRVIETLEAC